MGNLPCLRTATARHIAPVTSGVSGCSGCGVAFMLPEPLTWKEDKEHDPLNARRQVLIHHHPQIRVATSQESDSRSDSSSMSK
jgi:hypothetical protein